MKSFKDIILEEIIIEGISSKNKQGECYTKAYKYQEKHPDVTLVHGLVSGQGALEGIIYNHAWCEDKGKIIDMTLKPEIQKSLSKELYYAMGNIRTYFTYTIAERERKAFDEGTYGPWEDVLKKNKY